MDVFKQVNSLRRDGRVADARAMLADALRRGVFSAEQIQKAGQFLRKHPGEDRGLPVLLLGQCTTNWLADALVAEAWGRGIALHLSEGGYDQVLQDLHSQASGSTSPRLVILLPWSARILAGGDPSAHLEGELAFWRQAWTACLALGASVVQVGYDWTSPGPLGMHLSGSQPDGALRAVRELNETLRRSLPPGSFFVDLEAISGVRGRASFYDARRYFWTKQPFSEPGVCDLARALASAVRAITTGSKKVLVVDFDNTLWGGVVGETGPLGIRLGEDAEGEAFLAFQRYLKQLARRGVLLAGASKNNLDDGREPFEKNPAMVLALEDFAALEINWEPKGTTLQRIAETLSLGLDSLVFFDDNPAEREQVRQALPEVEVVEVPADPADYIAALEAGQWFESASLTSEDAARSQQYAVERQRREARDTFSSMGEYLDSLAMQGDLQAIGEPNASRVVQLLAKTNQFNLTTRRHSHADLLAILATERSIGIALSLADRFGDHGLIAVLLAVPDEQAADTLRIDTWLMSCRVIGRTVEQFLFGELLARARALGYRRLRGEYLPTKKNGLVSALYDSLGFARTGTQGSADGGCDYALDLETAVPPKTHVAPRAQG